MLPGWLVRRRWFGGKARALRGARIVTSIPIPYGAAGGRFALVEARYARGPGEIYSVPLAFTGGTPAAGAVPPAAVVTRLAVDGARGLLHAAEADPAFASALLRAVATGARFGGPRGDVVAWATRAFAAAARGAARLEPRPMAAEQSNTSIRFGDRLILKLFRRTEPGPNPDLEIGAFLTETAGFRNTPPLLGGIEYRPRRGEPWSLGIVQGFVRNAGDAWSFTLEAVAAFYARAAAEPALPEPSADLLAQAARAVPAPVRALVGPYLGAARLLGRRTAELHLALTSHPEVPAFSPERFTPRLQRRLVEETGARVAEAFGLLRRRRRGLAAGERRLAEAVLAHERTLIAGLGLVAKRPLTALRARIHGDYHLGQVLWTGRDYMIIDFEGEPARPLPERRARLSPLRDVAGMLRSFHYAAFKGRGAATGGRAAGGERLARGWTGWVSGEFLAGYLAAARGAPFLPATREELAGLLELFLTEKAVYELAYELNNRPEWVGIPLHGIGDRIGAAT